MPQLQTVSCCLKQLIGVVLLDSLAHFSQPRQIAFFAFTKSNLFAPLLDRRSAMALKCPPGQRMAAAEMTQLLGRRNALST